MDAVGKINIEGALRKVPEIAAHLRYAGHPDHANVLIALANEAADGRALRDVVIDWLKCGTIQGKARHAKRLLKMTEKYRAERGSKE